MTGLLISLAAGELLAVLTAAWMVRWRRRRQRDEWERLHRDVLKRLVKEDGWSENSVTPSVSGLIKAKAVRRDPDGIVTLL